ncbi:MAG TPA: fluoride efflux transporter CrcB [Micromonosporaceae bacterium]|nr:fluoride efflux transporter CrcB [Micromonosporaceae bacterium]
MDAMPGRRMRARQSPDDPNVDGRTVDHRKLDHRKLDHRMLDHGMLDHHTLSPGRLDHRLPTDSDVDLHVERQRSELLRAPWAVLTAIAVGGALGSLARYGLAVAFPPPPAGFPWATFAVNVSGGLLIGILMVLVTDVFDAQPLVRPLLGVGVLGGFTTFSTYVVDIQRIVNAGAAGTALAYLLGTLVAALAAVYLGIAVTRRALRGRLSEEPDVDSLRVVEEVRS